jgi:hypothetical protein
LRCSNLRRNWTVSGPIRYVVVNQRVTASPTITTSSARLHSGLSLWLPAIRATSSAGM